jgi:hypothetical protein
MTEPGNRIIASPLFDRERVANAIQRGVRLNVNPVYAKAALRGMPVELTNWQAHEVADVALEALAKTHPDGKTWLIKANEDYRLRGDTDDARWKHLLARQRRTTDSWRATALNAYVLLFMLAAVWEWHWPRWSYAIVVVVGFGGAGAFRQWLLRRDQRKVGGR